MAAGIAHEIRNPLGSISLYSEMLEDDLQGLDAAESAETARKIGTSVRRLDAIVRDVLDFARDLVVRPEAIETSDLIEAAIESPRFDEQFAEKADANHGSPRVTVRVESGAEVVFCDRSLGLQALLNVVENARQANAGCASGSDSGIEVFARPCRVRTGPNDSVEGVAIGVRDHGPGIDPGVLEPHVQPVLHDARDRHGAGARDRAPDRGCARRRRRGAQQQ